MQAIIDYYGTGNPIQDALLRFVLLLEGQQGRGYGDLKLDKALDEFIAHEGYLQTQEERTLLRDAETALMESISTTVTPMDKRKAPEVVEAIRTLRNALVVVLVLAMIALLLVLIDIGLVFLIQSGP